MFMISGITGYFPQIFIHVDNGMDKIEADDRRGLNYLWHVHLQVEYAEWRCSIVYVKATLINSLRMTFSKYLWNFDDCKW